MRSRWKSEADPATRRLATFRHCPLSRKNLDILWESHQLKTRTEFVHRLILNTICADFENLDQVILRDVAAVGAKFGVTIHRPEIVESLRPLVEAGLAKAYDLFPGIDDPFSGEFQGMAPLDVPEKCFRTYFYLTEKGKKSNRSDGTWWPLDDYGALRSDWEPPRG